MMSVHALLVVAMHSMRPPTIFDLPVSLTMNVERLNTQLTAICLVVTSQRIQTSEATVTPAVNSSKFQAFTRNMSESDEIELWCWVLGDTPNRVFSVSIKRSDTIYDLKIAIKGEKPPFKDIAADSLDLYKVGDWYW